MNPGRRGDRRQAVRLEVVELARDLQAAHVPVGRVGVTGRLARATQHHHVEARVVRDQHVGSGEGDEIVELLAPGLRADDVFRPEAVDARVQLEEPVMARRAAG